MRRVLSGIAGLAAGVLLAVSGLVGTAASTTDPIPRTQPLELGRYCHERYGAASVVYRPDESDVWNCTARINGIWGLEPIDLERACRWQRGEGARLQRRDNSESALVCTL
jgi:hypothetical protein